MANQNVEGTGFNGEAEEEDDQSKKFRKWILSHDGKPSMLNKLADKLLDADYDSMYVHAENE